MNMGQNNTLRSLESAYESSRRFYERTVAPMIHKEFREYENRIATGIAGEGSDCFGYDDFMSRDHDFGTGVCLWLADEDMDLFGQELSNAYEALVDALPDLNLTARLRARRGVMTIHDFYSNILGINLDTKKCVITDKDWEALDHNCLATAVNGVIFRDDAGEFTAFRNKLLNYYPDKIWKERIVGALHKYASALQVNYARCMSRRDIVAARLCHMNGLEAAAELFFLMKREYPPYYKWIYRRMTELDETGLFSGLVAELAELNPDTKAWEKRTYKPDEINMSDSIIVIAEQIAERIVFMLREHGLTEGTDPYLERYVDEVMRR